MEGESVRPAPRACCGVAVSIMSLIRHEKGDCPDAKTKSGGKRVEAAPDSFECISIATTCQLQPRGCKSASFEPAELALRAELDLTDENAAS